MRRIRAGPVPGKPGNLVVTGSAVRRLPARHKSGP